MSTDKVKAEEQKKPVSTDTVTFQLNGKSVSVPKGWTVMQAAKREGVAIPHFCWHPGLSIAGVCRFCMVKIEGRPKLEIACNLQATEGMQVRTDTDDVKDSHKWALEFHLINHPLDCPICDQAGECGLQNYYMEVGQYHSQMSRPKVLKPKALDVGGDLVLDTERCILCSRCVRFEDQVTKTSALGIFDRGDRSIIGIYPDKKITHNYTTNLVDICPVGAFTSKDFRFRQRVWFLEDKKSVCPGCSTGCAVDVFGKPQTGHYYRLKPRESDVNQHWMCDTGRHHYLHLNPEVRLHTAMIPADEKGTKLRGASISDALSHVAQQISSLKSEDIALLVSAQYTNEEYKALFDLFVGELKVKKIYQWREPTEKVSDFDGILYRGDHNANTRGLLEALSAAGLKATVKNEFDEVAKSGAKLIIALAPELATTFPSLATQLRSLSELGKVSLWTLNGSSARIAGFKSMIPMKGFAEKKGCFTNYDGKTRTLEESFPCGIQNARDVTEVVTTIRNAMKGAGKPAGKNSGIGAKGDVHGSH